MRLHIILLCFIWQIFCSGEVRLGAQDGGRIPVRIVNGKLITACDISTAYRRIPVNLFIDYDAPCGLQLHNKAAHPLGAESADGQPRPIQIHFPDFNIRVPKREHGDEDFLDDFTKYHSHEIGENAVVGTIGAEVLANYHVVFDLRRGSVELQAPRDKSGEPAAQEEGSVTVPVTLHAGLVWLPVRYANGDPAVMALGSSRYDTLVDRDVADDRGHPYGDFPGLRIQEVNFGHYVALRPAEVRLAHPDGVAGQIGINFLEHFRVEVDHVNRWARLRETRIADYPAEELQFFEAMVEEDTQLLYEFLDAHGETRLSKEAAELLLTLSLDEGAGDKEVHAAIDWIDRTQTEDLRTTRALDLMKSLAEDGWYGHVVYAGELGLESGRTDRYPDAVHEVHGKLGEVHLKQERGKLAWKHLLSAAFGLPDDGFVNLNLGRFYEQEGRYRRAFSRYVQACIVPESGPQAIEALQRVQARLPESEPFSVDLIERMIEGKVLNFGTATRFEADAEDSTNRTVLVEFFTNAHLRAALAGALGNEGLLSHFQNAPVAFLSYHLPEPALDPLVDEYALNIQQQRGVEGPWVHRIDGNLDGPGAGRKRDREAIFQRLRTQIETRLREPSDYSLELEVETTDFEVRGNVAVKGPADSDLRLHLVLAERGVLFPGKSEVVVHKYVARGSLTDDPAGEPLAMEADEFRLPFAGSIRDIAATRDQWLDEYMEDGKGTTQKISMNIDPGQVVVVAYLRDANSGEVHQAAMFEVESVEETQ